MEKEDTFVEHNMSAQDILDMTLDDVKDKEAKRKENIGKGFR